MRARGGALIEKMRQLSRGSPWVAIIALTIAMGCATTKPKSAPEATGNLVGTWSWGSPRRSADVPFLKISENDSKLRIQTKHYMHDYFVGDTKDISVDGSHLEFTYWYAPLCRWAKCNLDLSGDRMNGQCEGEAKATQWGEVPTYLWRENISETRN